MVPPVDPHTTSPNSKPAAGFGAGLLPLHSPLLRESSLVSSPPLIDMLKFSGYSRLIRGQTDRQTDRQAGRQAHTYPAVQCGAMQCRAALHHHSPLCVHTHHAPKSHAHWATPRKLWLAANSPATATATANSNAAPTCNPKRRGRRRGKLGGAQHSAAQRSTLDTAPYPTLPCLTLPYLRGKPHHRQRSGNPPSHCSLRTVIAHKPTLGQTWPQASLWPQYAFKVSMFKAVCDSH